MSGRGQARLWFGVLGAALVLSAVFGPHRVGGAARGPETQLDQWQLLGDKKLGRIATRFVGDTPPRSSLAEWNHEGIRLDMRLDEDELAAMRWRFNREFYKAHYVDAELRFGDGPPLTARVALRGSRSLDEFDELSFKIKLARPEEFAPGVEMRRLYLMALVEDPHKVKFRFAARLYADLGLFPLYHQLVDLYLNGERQGIALLCEPAIRGIRRADPTTTAIHRRDSKPKIYIRAWNDGQPEAERMMQALRSLNEEEELDDPVGTYARVIDLDAYLRFLAAASILMNQDAYGEVWLFQTMDEEGAPQPLRFCAWDLEDVAFAREKRDKHGTGDPLMFWAEGFLDHRIANLPELHERYRRTLAGLLDGELSVERIEGTLAEVHDLVDTMDPDPGRRAERARFVEDVRRLLVARHAVLERELERH